MSSGQDVGVVRTVTVLRKFLSGEEGISFRAAFLMFGAMLTGEVRPAESDAATSTADLPVDDSPTQNSVLVVLRDKRVSDYRRRGSRAVLHKLLALKVEFNTGKCLPKSVEFIWNSKKIEPEVLKIVESFEGDIFESAKDLADYENLLLNLIVYMGSHKRLGELSKSPVRNASTQTSQSFLSGRHNSMEDLLRRRQDKFTEEEWKGLVEQNRLLEVMARSRRSQGLRHSFTQTLASLHSGLKCVESETSLEFSWLDLAPNPIRFFPVFPAGTQTTEGHSQRPHRNQELVWSRMVRRLGASMADEMHPSFESYLPPMMGSWEDEVTAKFREEEGLETQEVCLGIKLTRLVHLLDDVVPTLCLTHKGPNPKPGCPACKAALMMPPPWADALFELIYSQYSHKRILSPNDGINDFILSKLQDNPAQSFLPGQCILIHSLRKAVYASTLHGLLKNIQDKDIKARETKKLKEGIQDCACPLPGHTPLSIAECLGNPQRLEELFLADVIKGLPGDPHGLHGHCCAFCRLTERQLGAKFPVCSECRRQRLFARAFYCSTVCLLKHHHEHRKVHDAFAPGRIVVYDSRSAILFPPEAK